MFPAPHDVPAFPDFSNELGENNAVIAVTNVK